ncbi:hypothetical protein EWE75_24060 [Sphingomonas populi]|uniref:Uncharacterized protein n=1 Tax=Sphingomonas populi TaxID=2484750 RepID=A0A4Q6XIH7_9SPHN|nr:hypothetical protein [Sphingomonas populi]RZF59025.1 hypothetical protein EWE75_24060 [Sphingomonas populi]
MPDPFRSFEDLCGGIRTLSAWMQNFQRDLLGSRIDAGGRQIASSLFAAGSAQFGFQASRQAMNSEGRI